MYYLVEYLATFLLKGKHGLIESFNEILTLSPFSLSNKKRQSNVDRDKMQPLINFSIDLLRINYLFPFLSHHRQSSATHLFKSDAGGGVRQHPNSGGQD